MKAIADTEYGAPDVLRMEEVETPVPGDDQLLVKVYASSVNYSDWAFLGGKRFEVRADRSPRFTRHCSSAPCFPGAAASKCGA